MHEAREQAEISVSNYDKIRSQETVEETEEIDGEETESWRNWKVDREFRVKHWWKAAEISRGAVSGRFGQGDALWKMYYREMDLVHHGLCDAKNEIWNGHNFKDWRTDM